MWLTHQDMIYPGESCLADFFNEWLAGVWYVGEIDSPGYPPPGTLTRRGIIPRGDWTIWINWQILNQNRKYFNPLVSGPGRFELWKKWRSKISLDCPFNPTSIGYCTKLDLQYPKDHRQASCPQLFCTKFTGRFYLFFISKRVLFLKLLGEENFV